MKENAFRLPAGPEVDAAWETLGVNCKIFSDIGIISSTYHESRS